MYSQRSFRTQNHRSLARQLAAIAVRECDFRALNLSFTATPHQLLRRFYQGKQTIHTRVYARLAAAIGIDGQATAWSDTPTFDKTAAFALGAKP